MHRLRQIFKIVFRRSSPFTLPFFSHALMSLISLGSRIMFPTLSLYLVLTHPLSPTSALRGWRLFLGLMSRDDISLGHCRVINYLYAFIFAREKGSREQREHPQRSVTSSRFEYYTRFICMFMYFIYIFQVKTRSFHSQKEPRKCHALFPPA